MADAQRPAGHAVDPFGRGGDSSYTKFFRRAWSIQPGPRLRDTIAGCGNGQLCRDGYLLQWAEYFTDSQRLQWTGAYGFVCCLFVLLPGPRISPMGICRRRVVSDFPAEYSALYFAGMDL